MLLVAALCLAPAPGGAAEPESAREWFRKGVALQKERRTLEAIEAYREALEREPFHARAHYELGWSYWVLGKWEKVVRHWEIARDLEVGIPELEDFLGQARRNLADEPPPLVRVPIGRRAAWQPGGAGGRGLALELVARFQQYRPDPEHPRDHFDRRVFSPKSVHFTPDGRKAYVNALEGFATLVYDPGDFRRLAVIPHRFGAADAHLFEPEGDAGPAWRRWPDDAGVARPRRFRGKPVESAHTHGGRYLWVSYYRRDYDELGVLPSAVAAVDTRSDEIVRVIPTGPIPKYLAASPDGRWLAVVHWGHNTVGLIDIRGEDPGRWKRGPLITVEHRLPLDLEEKVDRDRYCGFCLRGAVFTPDGRHLLVGRMGGGGIAVLNVTTGTHVGSVWGMKPTPRHLLLSPDSDTLYVGSNITGYVARYRTDALVRAARQGRRRLAPERQTHTGVGTRTLDLTPDGRVLFAAVHNSSKVVALDARTLEPLLEIPADSFPVGLAVHPDGHQLWVTAQGRKLRGGNSVSVYRIERGATATAAGK